MFRSAKTRAARTSLSFASRTYSSATSFQCPGGEYVPAPSFHFCAIASWAEVRCSTVRLTSAVSSFICCDAVDGGGGGRWATISAGVMFHARTWPNNGSIGGRAGMSWLTQATSPRAVAESASAFHKTADPPAVFIPSPAARARNTVATDFPRARPAARSLAVALPDQSAAFRCSAALRVTSSTAAGNSVFSISTVTPDMTASSDGYDGSPDIGISAVIELSFFAGDSRLYWNFQYHADLSASYCAALT